MYIYIYIFTNTHTCIVLYCMFIDCTKNTTKS